MERKRRTLSRRDFLQVSGLTALLAGLSALCGCNAFPTPEPSSDSGTETLKIPENTPFITFSQELADYITQPELRATIFTIDESLAHSTSPDRLAEVYKSVVLKQGGTINETEKNDLSSFVSVTNSRFIVLGSQLETQLHNTNSFEQFAFLSNQVQEHLIRGLIDVSFQHLHAEHTNNFDLLCAQINRKIELMLLANHWASWFELKRVEINQISPLTQEQDKTTSRWINEWRKIGKLIHRQLLSEYEFFKSRGWQAHWDGQPSELKELVADQTHWLELANNVSSISEWQSLINQYFATRIETEPEFAAVYQQQHALLSQNSEAMPISEVAKTLNPDGIFFTQTQMVAIENGMLKIQYSNQKCSFNYTESVPLSALGLKDNTPLDKLFLYVDQISPLYVELNGKPSLTLLISLHKELIPAEYQADNFYLVASEIIILTTADYTDKSIDTKINSQPSSQKVFNTLDQLNTLTELQFTKGTTLEISKLHLEPTQMMSLILSEDDTNTAIQGIDQAISEFGGNFHYRQLALASPETALYRKTDDTTFSAVGSLKQLAGYENGLVLPVIPDKLLNTDAINRVLGVLNQTGKNVFLPVPNTDLYIALDDISVKIIGQKSSASYYANRYKLANLLIALNRIRFPDTKPKKYRSPPSSPKPTLTLLEELQDFFSMRTVAAITSNPQNHPLVGIPAIMSYGSRDNKESYLPYIPGLSQYYQQLVEMEQNERLFLDGSSLPNKKTISLDN